MVTVWQRRSFARGRKEADVSVLAVRNIGGLHRLLTYFEVNFMSFDVLASHKIK
jgi:hypothetical protein